MTSIKAGIPEDSGSYWEYWKYTLSSDKDAIFKAGSKAVFAKDHKELVEKLRDKFERGLPKGLTRVEVKPRQSYNGAPEAPIFVYKQLQADENLSVSDIQLFARQFGTTIDFNGNTKAGNFVNTEQARKDPNFIWNYYSVRYSPQHKAKAEKRRKIKANKEIQNGKLPIGSLGDWIDALSGSLEEIDGERFMYCHVLRSANRVRAAVLVYELAKKLGTVAKAREYSHRYCDSRNWHTCLKNMAPYIWGFEQKTKQDASLVFEKRLAALLRKECKIAGIPVGKPSLTKRAVKKTAKKTITRNTNHVEVASVVGQ